MDIILLKKEIFGMQSDKEEFIYKDILKFTECCFEQYFQSDIRLAEKRYSNCSVGMGAFYLQYEYLNNYKIIFDYENMYFNINIYNDNGGRISLYEICNKIVKSQYGEKWQDWSLKIGNIKSAIKILATTLKTEKLYFYIYKDGKIYREQDGCVKRIKDVSELNLQLN